VSQEEELRRQLYESFKNRAILYHLIFDEMRRDLGALLARCTALHALQVTDGKETRVQATGDFDLVDVETGARMASRAAPDGSAGATRERAAMTHRLRSFCTRSSIAFTDWNVAQLWQQTLVAHLARAQSVC
jgi:hypothetical protein